MTDDPKLDSDRALYFSWRAAELRAAAAGGDVRRPSAMELASYADRTLDDVRKEAVEAAMAGSPHLLREMLALRRGGLPEHASEKFLDRARQLVPSEAPARRGADIVKLAPPRKPRRYGLELGGIVTWGALAASILIVSMLGFNIGMATQQAIEQVPGAAAVDLLEQADPVVG